MTDSSKPSGMWCTLGLAALATLGCSGSVRESAGFVRPAAQITFATEIPLTDNEVDAIIERAASALDAPRLTVAVVDRFGRPLGVWTRSAATSVNDLNIALSIARTGAFLSSTQGPITTRTLEYISTFHFPPTFGALTRNPIPTSPFTLEPSLASQRETTGVAGTGQGALWQIYSCNRGAPVSAADLAADGIVLPVAQQTDFIPGQEVPPPRRIDGSGNPVFATAGPGISYLAGGIPLYKDGVGPAGARTFDLRLVGGIGCYVTDAVGTPDPAAMEYASLVGAGSELTTPFAEQLDDPATNPVPSAEADRNFFFPVPPDGVIFLLGVLLPEHNQVTRPAGYLAASPGTTPETGGGLEIVAAQPGPPMPFGYMVAPRDDPLGNLSALEVDGIVQRAIAEANGTRAAIRLLPPFVGSESLGSPTKMWISVTNLDGVPLAVFRMEDAPVFSFDVSLTKARNVTYFSSAPPRLSAADQLLLNGAGLPSGLPGPGLDGVSVTPRTFGFLTQPFYPPGIRTNPTPGPLFALAAQNADPSQYNRMGNAPPSPGLQSGIIFFPGAAALYRGTTVIGGVGISGDGVEQDDFVTAAAVAGFEPPPAIRADRFSFAGAPLPYFKFPLLPGPGGG